MGTGKGRNRKLKFLFLKSKNSKSKKKTPENFGTEFLGRHPGGMGMGKGRGGKLKTFFEFEKSKLKNPAPQILCTELCGSQPGDMRIRQPTHMMHDAPHPRHPNSHDEFGPSGGGVRFYNVHNTNRNDSLPPLRKRRCLFQDTDKC